MNDILQQIADEREYQKTKWGNHSDDMQNTPWMFVSYICQYATKWMVGSFPPIKSYVTDDFRQCMIKVAAIAVAAVESIDRQRELRGKTFYEEEAR